MRLLVTILSLLLSSELSATIYYVKSSGGTGSGLNDANAWSLAKYNSMAASLNTGDGILLNRGDIFYGAFPVKSGVSYNSYGFGAQPIITGFTSLTSWTNVGTNLWEASVSAGSQLNMVTVNGAIAEPGRFPNTSWLTMTVSGPSDGGFPSSYTTFTTTTPSPSNYAGGKVVIKKREWVIEKAQISSISGSTVNFVNPPSGDPVNHPDGDFPAHNTWGFFFVDHPYTLDVQNEWYYNGSGTLRMYSTVNPSTLNVKAATVNTLVSLGTTTNVSFSTITFEGSNQSAIFSYDGGSGNSFTNCEIRFAGYLGIDTKFQSYFTVKDCKIYQINYSAITSILGDYQSFSDNEVHDAGMLPTLCQPNNKANHGIWVNGTNNVVKRNEVSYVGYVGIDISGNFDTCKKNFVHHAMQKAADGGGIYMSDETNGKGRVIDSNIIAFSLGPRDGTPYTGFDNAMGIYLDESTAGVIISNNFSVLNNGGGIYLHKAHHVNIVNNIFYGNTKQQVLMAEDNAMATRITGVVMTNNQLHSLSPSDYIYRFFGAGSISNFFTDISGNILSRPASSSNIINEVLDFYATADNLYSLTSWKAAFPAFDRNSSGTPSHFATGSPDLYLAFKDKNFQPLNPGIYKDLRGFPYGTGIAVIPPFSGIVINKTEDFPAVTPQSTVIRGRIL